MQETIFECRCCDRTCKGWNDGTFQGVGWNRIERIDGPNALCPTCTTDESAMISLVEQGYPNAKVVRGESAFVSVWLSTTGGYVWWDRISQEVVVL